MQSTRDGIQADHQVWYTCIPLGVVIVLNEGVVFMHSNRGDIYAERQW
jgi:hypothetical protein